MITDNRTLTRVFKALIVTFCLSIFSVSAQPIEVVDLAGRSVTIPKVPKKIILGEGRMMYTLALLEKGNPFERVVGWKDDLMKWDPDAYRAYLSKFPQAENIANLGSPYSNDFSIEKVITLNADLMILNLGNLLKAKETGLIEKLEKVGVQVIFVDFRQRPTQNTVPSIYLLGQALGRVNEANQFINYYQKHMKMVYGRVVSKKEEDKPIVFIDRAAGFNPDKCCSTFGSANLGRLVDEAGGINWGSRKFSGFSGKVNPEAIFAEDPDVIIGTGANWSEAKPDTAAVLFGYEATKEKAQQRLKKLSERKGWPTLSSVKNKKFYSVYHQFYNSPYHFVALLTFAKWFYPNDFKDVDPEKIFVELHDKFLPIDYSGVFWAELH
ncbi:putative ABC-type Fe3+-hydroxamate transport system, periplasmic component [Vibrio nigripulchritudo SFn27]|uniref:Putative ABC-type Fe3+-hydroxamate transport system, periplasmic component n=1 Tax=Vibrio nigripulchritudo TaxID=28173 RepID=U4KAZ2_9VIBR|nr:ABC transporter substrate-binding protein [Vibrio nigripulchritudo]CCN81107.1 putative ABC-type Fe3+-hydroxamate transport system, periplasmic component [Vibrio nigripulchritudo BLFn1]CCN86559.1 putative ABC-type Fe3+-hydroxamate transport system, periplasmic component [Vibrio nigripulchritudo SFn27]CCN92866.1 putative ABC-type Fe3+-hydroxamate transport system, periplasmic component [Vibrio nigripulchritudo ENn2]CCO40175.1 putative ABC-type Fe3+-hydroxamate transport system, periplasmic com